MRSTCWSWFRSKAVSDEEYVEQIRRQVDFHLRWRKTLITFYSGLALVFVIMLSVLVPNLITWLVHMFGNRWIVSGGFGVGLLLGIMTGQVGHQIGCGLVASISSPRTERLLIQYHDAIETISEEGLGLISFKENCKT